MAELVLNTENKYYYRMSSSVRKLLDLTTGNNKWQHLQLLAALTQNDNCWDLGLRSEHSQTADREQHQTLPVQYSTRFRYKCKPDTRTTESESSRRHFTVSI